MNSNQKSTLYGNIYHRLPRQQHSTNPNTRGPPYSLFTFYLLLSTNH